MIVGAKCVKLRFAKAEMTAQSPTLRDWPYYMVRLACNVCPRRGRYRKDKLMLRFGGDIPMPELRHKIAICPREEATGDACGVYLSGLQEECSRP
jgi:hypothetical protein